jgi:hypothetical protein
MSTSADAAARRPCLEILVQGRPHKKMFKKIVYNAAAFSHLGAA